MLPIRFLLPAILVVTLAATTATAQTSEPAAGAPAQPTIAAAPPVAEAFQSPFATLETFLEAMSEGDRERAAECLDLSLVSRDGAEDRAQELYRILNRIEYVDFVGDLTLQATRADRIGDLTSWTMFPRDLSSNLSRLGGNRALALRKMRRFQRVERRAPNARIVLEKSGEGGEWRFSAETVEGVRDLWDTLRRSGLETVAELQGEESLTVAERLESLWPLSFVDNGFLGVRYWQWITLFVIVFVGIVLDFTVRFLLTLTSRRVIRRRGGDAATETVRRTVRPFGLTAAALLWLWAIGLLNLPDPALTVLVPAVRLFAMLAMVWSAFRVTDLTAEVASSKAARTETRFDDLLIPLARKALKVFIAIFGLIYIADSFAVPIAPLLTGLGIGGAGFAFAAKDTLEHLFGSVTVITDRPFEVGDWVEIGDVEGTVEELGFRSTRVRTFYNSLVTIPNGNLVRAVVDNFGKRKYRRWTTHLNLTYDTPPDSLEAFCEGVREIIRFHPYTRKDYYQVWVHKFGAHSLDVLLYVFFETPDWNTELRERHRLILEILRLADRLGVEFAFPTQTLHMYSEEHGAERTPAEAPAADAERRAQIIGRRAVRSLIADASWRVERPGPYEFEYADDSDGEDDGTQIESKTGGSA